MDAGGRGSYQPSPLVLDDLLYVADNGGILTCYMAETGEEMYRNPIGGDISSYSASPVAADRKLYFSDEYGNIHIVKAGPKYEHLLVNKMDEICMASPDLRGELIAVKQNSLLLLEHASGIDTSVDIKDVNIIKIVKKSKTLAWGSIGLLSGGVMGALIGYVEGDDPPGYITGFGPPMRMEHGLFKAGDKALGYGFCIGLSGAILGGIIGALEGADKTIPIEGKSDSEIKEILEKLSKKARVRDFY